jgi:hypothetical protein
MPIATLRVIIGFRSPEAVRRARRFRAWAEPFAGRGVRLRGTFSVLVRNGFAPGGVA